MGCYRQNITWGFATKAVEQGRLVCFSSGICISGYGRTRMRIKDLVNTAFAADDDAGNTPAAAPLS